MTKLNLSVVHPELHEQVMSSWKEGDADGVMVSMGHHLRGRFILDNRVALKAAGMYERALFLTYTHGPHLHPGCWRFLFSGADRAALLAIGDPPPPTPLTVYRGVSCARRKKWIRGLSWSTNKGIAAWFATRYSSAGGDPAVYSLTVDSESILFATNERGENEIVVAAWQCGRMRRVLPMPDPVRPE